jgi:adenylosuccinate synthase
VALRHSARVNALTGLAITKLDILDGMDEVKACTAYRFGGKTLTEFPKEATVLRECVPVYETLKGWKGSTYGKKAAGELPEETRKYLKFIEAALGVPVQMISTGPKRDQLIVLREAFDRDPKV